MCSYPAKYSLFVESKDSPKKAHIKKFEGIRTPDLKIIKLQRQQVPTGLTIDIESNIVSRLKNYSFISECVLSNIVARFKNALFVKF